MPRSEIPYIVQNPDTGVAIPNAVVNVYVRNETTPANTPADVYTGETGTSKFTLPLSSGDKGQITGWLEEGSYTLSVSGANISPFSQAIESFSGRTLAKLDGSRLVDLSVLGGKIADQTIPETKLVPGVTVPTGSIFPFAGTVATQGFLLCQGQSLSQTTYSKLFGVIGTTYGSNDGASFSLPDLRSRVPLGAGQGPGLSNFPLGRKLGEENHTLTEAELPAHRHLNQLPLASDYSNFGNIITELFTVKIAPVDGAPYGPGSSLDAAPFFSAYAGGNQAHNVMQPYIALNYLIKF